MLVDIVNVKLNSLVEVSKVRMFYNVNGRLCVQHFSFNFLALTVTFCSVKTMTANYANAQSPDFGVD